MQLKNKILEELYYLFDESNLIGIMHEFMNRVLLVLHPKIRNRETILKITTNNPNLMIITEGIKIDTIKCCGIYSYTYLFDGIGKKIMNIFFFGDNDFVKVSNFDFSECLFRIQQNFEITTGDVSLIDFILY